MRRVTFYTRAGCHLCDQAREVLNRARRRVAFRLDVIDIDAAHPAVRSRYTDDVPVIAIDGQDLFRWSVDEAALMARLTSPSSTPPASPEMP
jgi:glutaredoxin